MANKDQKSDFPEGYEQKLKKDYIFIDSDFSELEVTDSFDDYLQIANQSKQ